MIQKINRILHRLISNSQKYTTHDSVVTFLLFLIPKFSSHTPLPLKHLSKLLYICVYSYLCCWERYSDLPLHKRQFEWEIINRMRKFIYENAFRIHYEINGFKTTHIFVLLIVLYFASCLCFKVGYCGSLLIKLSCNRNGWCCCAIILCVW